MSYSKKLAERVRTRLSDLPNIEEKEMMGGLTFMYNSKMCVGIIKDELMCRLDPEIFAHVLEMTGCRTMDFTGRPMKGFVMVDESGMRTESELDHWINLALDFNKKAKSSKRKKSS